MQPPAFSVGTFSLLVLILLASTAVFTLLVRRWTVQRQWVALQEWARNRRMRIRRSHDQALAGLKQLGGSDAQLLLTVFEDAVMMAQLKTPAEAERGPARWHVLVRRTHRRRERAALRPMERGACLVDRAGLTGYPSLDVGQRFAALGASWNAARAVCDSPLRTLVPPDIAVAVGDEWIVLDFSTRRFDPIELDRMLALSRQLGQLLD